ncbi:hypothetical protein BVX97_06210 [bacterium E08(2017)]|nr:hypothetical protein BVX97_06210 [bacterium E08(2017)]
MVRGKGNMKSILAIAGLAVKTSVRSKLVISLSVILLMVVLGLPFSIKGDGTLNGQTALLIYYSLAFSSIILGIATLWVSCWTISREVEEKYIQMLVVKPVRRSYIWIGKWLGIAFLNGVLLIAAGAVTYIAVQLKVSDKGADADEVQVTLNEVLVSRLSMEPDREDVSDEAHKLMHELVKRGVIPKETSHVEAYEQAYKQVMAKRAVVRPGSSKEWRFDISDIGAQSEAWLRYHLSMSARERNPVSGEWVIGTDKNPDALRVSIDNYLFGRHMLEVPSESLDGAAELTVKFINADREKSNIAYFDIEDDLELLVESGSFTGNYIRSLVILFCQLAVLAAMGLTAGSLLTFPVASFSVASLLAIAMLSHYFTISYDSASGHQHHECEDHGHSHEYRAKTVLLDAMEGVVLNAHIIVKPAMKYRTLSNLSSGNINSPKTTLEAVLILLLLYPGLLGLVGAWFLNKREMAL